MKLNKKEHSCSGIYCIQNKINNKKYVGKAKDIYKRMKDHITRLNKKSKDENPHLINSWHKYGKENFEYFILEYVKLDDTLLRKRELHWQRKLEVTNRNKGYNIRLDSETGLIVSDETREKCRNSQIKRFENPEERKKCSHDFWKRNPDKLAKMAKEVAQMNLKYKIEQYDKKSKKLVKTWNSIIELMQNHPEYKKHNIYAVCSGEKPSMYGYIWKKVKL